MCVIFIRFKTINSDKCRNKIIHFKHTADSDTVLTHQVSSVQLVTDKKLQAFNKA